MASEICRGTILLSNTYREQIFTSYINTGTSIIHANYMINGPNTNTTIDSNIYATMAGPIAVVVWEIDSYRRHKVMFLSPYDNIIVASYKQD